MSSKLIKIFSQLETQNKNGLVFHHSFEIIVKEIERIIIEPFKKLHLSKVTETVVIKKGNYYLENDITVLEGGKLIIEAGVHLYFSKHCGMIILGTLNVSGKVDDFVFISGNGWSNITFSENSFGYSSKSFLKYVIVHGGNGSSKNPGQENSYFYSKEKIRGGNIFIKGTNLFLDHVIISNGKAKVGGGVYAYKGILEMRNSFIINNKAIGTGGIEIYSPGHYGHIISSLENVVIDSNRSIDSAGGILVNKGTIDLSRLRIQNNYSEESCGGMTIRNTSINPFQSCDVEYVKLIDSIIMNNCGSTNGGLYCSNCFLTSNNFSSNLISNNIARDTNAHDYELDILL